MPSVEILGKNTRPHRKATAEQREMIDKQAKALRKEGKLFDGDKLFLMINPEGKMRFIINKTLRRGKRVNPLIKTRRGKAV